MPQRDSQSSAIAFELGPHNQTKAELKSSGARKGRVQHRLWQRQTLRNTACPHRFCQPSPVAKRKRREFVQQTRHAVLIESFFATALTAGFTGIRSCPRRVLRTITKNGAASLGQSATASNTAKLRAAFGLKTCAARTMHLCTLLRRRRGGDSTATAAGCKIMAGT